MLTSPCKDCQVRYVGCHSKCLKYIDFRQSMDIINKNIYDAKSKNNEFRSLKRDGCEKQRRRHSK